MSSSPLPVPLSVRAGTMKMLLEIHMPGLDLDAKRWNYHTIFMTELHANVGAVGARAYAEYQALGRGVLFADAEQWLQVVKRSLDVVKSSFPLRYVPREQILKEVDYGVLQGGIVQLLDGYDPEEQFLLLVNHHPGDVQSCYLIAPEPGPAVLCQTLPADCKSDSAPGEA